MRLRPLRGRLLSTVETAQPAGGDENPGSFDAIREQLGLKLTPARAPVSVLVVDNATLPTAD